MAQNSQTITNQQPNVVQAQQTAQPTQDPFAAIGGGVQLASGAWVPKDHPLAQQQAAVQSTAAQPANRNPTPAPAQAASPTTSTGTVTSYPNPQLPPYQIPISPATPQISQITPPTAAPYPTAPAAPTYQTYQYTPQTIGTPQMQGLISASNVQQFGNQPPTATNAAGVAFGQALANAVPNTAGQKEQQKETLNAIQQQQLDALHAGAALRGTSRGGETASLANTIGNQFAQNLTGAYRDIDQKAQQDAFNNLLSAGGALEGLGNTQFGQSLQSGQFNLAQQQAQQGANQQGFQNALAEWQSLLGQGANAAQYGLNAAQLGLTGQQAQVNRDLSQAGLENQNRQQSLAELLGIGGLNLQGQQQQLATQVAGQQAQQAQASLDLQKLLGLGSQGLQQQQLNQQNAQFYAQLAQAMDQFNQNLGFQGSVASNNANNGLVGLILQTLGLA